MDWQMIGAIAGPILGVGGVSASLITLLKEKRKDDAIADLTTVESLQKQVIALDDINKFLRNEIKQLQEDYATSEEQRRRMRFRLAEVEEELEQVRRRCDNLSETLRQIQSEGSA